VYVCVTRCVIARLGGTFWRFCTLNAKERQAQMFTAETLTEHYVSLHIRVTESHDGDSHVSVTPQAWSHDQLI